MNTNLSEKIRYFVTLIALICSLGALVCSIVCCIHLNEFSVEKTSFPENKKFFTKSEAANYLGIALEDFDQLAEWRKLNPENTIYMEPITLENGSVYYTLEYLKDLGNIRGPTHSYLE